MISSHCTPGLFSSPFRKASLTSTPQPPPPPSPTMHKKKGKKGASSKATPPGAPPGAPPAAGAPNSTKPFAPAAHGTAPVAARTTAAVKCQCAVRTWPAVTLVDNAKASRIQRVATLTAKLIAGEATVSITLS